MRRALLPFTLATAGLALLAACGSSGGPTEGPLVSVLGPPPAPDGSIVNADSGLAEDDASAAPDVATPSDAGPTPDASAAPDASLADAGAAVGADAAGEDAFSFSGFPCGLQQCDSQSEFCIGRGAVFECVRFPKSCPMTQACACLMTQIGGQQWNCTDMNGQVMLTTSQ